MAGFIYIMSNPSFSDRIIKIGKSKSDPKEFRKDELYSTGVPEPFVVEYYALVEDYNEVELKVHKRFKIKRRNKNREFFSCTIIEAVEAIRELADIKFEEKFFEEPEPLQIKYQDSGDHPEKQAQEAPQRARDIGAPSRFLSGPFVFFIWIPIIVIGLVVLF